MTEATKDNPRKIKTDPFRMSFPAILKVRISKDDNDKEVRKHELTLLFPPGTDTGRYKAALKAAMVEKFGDDPSKWPRVRHKADAVLKDFNEYNAGAKKPLPGKWDGWTMIRTSSPEDKPPGVVGPVRDPKTGKFPVITDARDVYGGRWARATIEAYYFDKKGGGVTFGLVNVQLLKHDTPFGNGAAKAEDDFDDASSDWAGEDGTKEGKTDDSGWD